MIFETLGRAAQHVNTCLVHRWPGRIGLLLRAAGRCCLELQPWLPLFNLIKKIEKGFIWKIFYKYWITINGYLILGNSISIRSFKQLGNQKF